MISSSESLDKSKSDILDRLLLERGKGSWNEMIIHWDEAKEPLNELNSLAQSGDLQQTLPLTSVRLDAPLPDPRNRIIALGANVAAPAVNAFKAITGQEYTEDHFHKEQRDGLFWVTREHSNPGTMFTEKEDSAYFYRWVLYFTLRLVSCLRK